MSNDRFLRQSFLGECSQSAIENAVVGIVGLGGGGSHIAMQLPYVGFLNFRVYDPDVVTWSNLNRTMIADEADAAVQSPKVEVARRRILGIQSKASVQTYDCRWQDLPEPLRDCDMVFGCVDTFKGRQELEVCCRRYLIPYIDVGMDVHQVADEPPRMGGQVILSMPGELCMRCLGFLSDERLATEAALYGDAGGRPQVIWPNGVLASTAVGIGVKLLTNWSRPASGPIYMSYDGNNDTLAPHVRLKHLPKEACPHFSLDKVGKPVFEGV